MSEQLTFEKLHEAVELLKKQLGKKAEFKILLPPRLYKHVYDLQREAMYAPEPAPPAIYPPRGFPLSQNVEVLRQPKRVPYD